jgi:hypothetical protein
VVWEVGNICGWTNEWTPSISVQRAGKKIEMVYFFNIPLHTTSKLHIRPSHWNAWCPSVYPHILTLKPFNRFWLNFQLDFYTEIGQHNLIFARSMGTRSRSWFRHYATSRKVAGSIPDEVIGFFNWPNPSNRTMALGSTQPLTEMSTRNLPGGKGQPVRGADNLTAICEPIV